MLQRIKKDIIFMMLVCNTIFCYVIISGIGENFLIIIDYFIVYTYEESGYVAAVGREFDYMKSLEKKTIFGKLIKLKEPLTTIVVPLENIRNHYKTMQICTQRCRFTNGTWIHNHIQNVVLLLKID